MREGQVKGDHLCALSQALLKNLMSPKDPGDAASSARVPGGHSAGSRLCRGQGTRQLRPDACSPQDTVPLAQGEHRTRGLSGLLGFLVKQGKQGKNDGNT